MLKHQNIDYKISNSKMAISSKSEFLHAFIFNLFFVVKIKLEGPPKELVQLAVRQMAPFLKPEETQSLIHSCNNNPKSLAGLARYSFLQFLFHKICIFIFKKLKLFRKKMTKTKDWFLLLLFTFTF